MVGQNLFRTHARMLASVLFVYLMLMTAPAHAQLAKAFRNAVEHSEMSITKTEARTVRRAEVSTPAVASSFSRVERRVITPPITKTEPKYLTREPSPFARYNLNSSKTLPPYPKITTTEKALKVPFSKFAKTTPEKITGKEKIETNIVKPYRRPNNSTTKEQRASVQGKPCIKCGTQVKKMVAGHKKAIVKEYYETGTIDKKRMQSKSAVQPECPTCSAREGAQMSRYSKNEKKKRGL